MGSESDSAVQTGCDLPQHCSMVEYNSQFQRPTENKTNYSKII